MLSSYLSEYTDNELREFVLNSQYNPKTGRKLKIGSKFHKQLSKEAKKRNIRKNNIHDNALYDILNDLTNNPYEITKLILEYVGCSEIFYIVSNKENFWKNIIMCNSLSAVDKIVNKYTTWYEHIVDNYNYRSRPFKIYILQAPITLRFDMNNLSDNSNILQKIEYKDKKFFTETYNEPDISKINVQHKISYIKFDRYSTSTYYFQNIEDVIHDIYDSLEKSDSSLYYEIFQKELKNSISNNYFYTKVNGSSLISISLNKHVIRIVLKNEFKPYTKEIKTLLSQKFISLN